MADTNVENTPEHVAYTLMRDIALVEGKHILQLGSTSADIADRQWLLSTYSECLAVVKT